LNANGASPYSNEASATPEAQVSAPPAPTGLGATGVSGQVFLSWTPIAGATTYNLYRSTNPGGEGSTAYQTGLTGLSYLDQATTSGATYYYTLAAVNACGASAQSAEASAIAQVADGQTPKPGGHYSPPKYTGGTYTSPTSSGAWTPTGRGYSSSFWGATSVSGSITAYFQWNPDPGCTGIPPPKQVIVEQMADVWWVDPYNDGPNAGTADCGMMGAFNSTYPVGVEWGGSSLGTKDFILDTDSSGDVTIPEISVSGTAKDGGGPGEFLGVWGSYMVSIFPVTINPLGATVDSKGMPAAMIGQGIKASLTTIPAPVTISAPPPPQIFPYDVTYSDYVWHIDGNKKASFDLAADQSTGTYYDVDPSALWSADPFWFWYDNGKKWGKSTPANITVFATANVAGVSIGRVKAKTTIDVWAPSAQVGSIAPTSTIQLPSSYSPSANSPTDIYSGTFDVDVQTGTPVGYYPVGNVPTKFYDAGWGTIFPLQLCNLSRTGIINTTTHGQFWLDNQFQYLTPQNADPAGVILSYDTPSTGLSWQSSKTVQDQFKTYFMYDPPVASYYPVPIYEVSWKWDVTDAHSTASGWLPSIPGWTSLATTHPPGYPWDIPTWANIFANKD